MKLNRDSKMGLHSSTDTGDTCAQNKPNILYIYSTPKGSLNLSLFWNVLLWTPVHDSCSKTEPQNMFQCSLNGLLVSDVFWFCQLIASLFFGFTTCSCSDVSQAARCASCSDLVSLREDPKITRFFIYLFIYPALLPCCCFVSQTDKRIRANWIWPADSCLK